MKKFIEELGKFFKKNWINISFVVVALFLILAIVAIKNIEFKDHPNKELEKIIMYEKFRGREGFREGATSAHQGGKKAAKKKKGALEAPAGSPDVGAADDPEFCKRTDSDLEKACKDLREADCKVSDCCIWATPQDNAPVCMAGDENGASYNANKKSLEEWWYKGPKNDEAIQYPKKSDNFEPRKQEKIGGKHKPLEDTEAVIEQKEKEAEAEDDAIQTVEQKVAIDQNQERAERLMKQQHALKKLKMEQSFINELATLKDAQKAKNVAADTEEQTVQALKIVANQKKLEMDEKEIDDLKLEHAINKITAEDEGEGVSTTDKTNLAKARVEIESKKRELTKRANEAKQQSQGELAGGEKVNGETNAADLAKKITPESVGGGPNKALLLGIQNLMKKSALTGDGIGKAAHGQLSKLGTNKLETLLPSKGNVAVEAFIGRARSGLTNYFR